VVNTAILCPHTPRTLFHRNQLNSCLFVNIFLQYQNFDGAPSAYVGPVELQRRVLEGACNGVWVFDKGGKTRMPRWTSGSPFTRAVAWSSSTWRGQDRPALERFISTCAARLRLVLLLVRENKKFGRRF
jgi:hypothetical protein